MPIFLDIEASSFSKDSYPIEIAWGDRADNIVSYLINPSEVESWTDWSLASQNVHSISLDELRSNGESPIEVAEALTNDLDNKIVYTDNPDFDGMWLFNLFQGIDYPIPSIQLRHIDEILFETLQSLSNPHLEIMKIIAQAKAASRDTKKQHRAHWDVQYLIRVWKKILSH